MSPPDTSAPDTSPPDTSPPDTSPPDTSPDCDKHYVRDVTALGDTHEVRTSAARRPRFLPPPRLRRAKSH